MHLVLLVVVLVATAAASTEFEIAAPFANTNIKSALSNWDSKGSVHLSTEAVVLTPRMKSMKGFLSYNKKIEASAFDLTMDVNIEGSRLGGAEGMIIAFSEKPQKEGTFLGISHSVPSVVVGLDTYPNSRSITGSSRPGIFIGNLDGYTIPSASMDYSDIEVSSCKSQLRNTPTKLRIKYSNKVLSLYIQNQESLSPDVPCARANMELPSSFYLSLGAMTGVLGDQHAITTMKLVTKSDADPFQNAATYHRDPVQNSSGYNQHYDQQHQEVEYNSFQKSSDVDTKSLMNVITNLHNTLATMEKSIKQLSANNHASKLPSLEQSVNEVVTKMQGLAEKVTMIEKNAFKKLEVKMEQDNAGVDTKLQAITKAIDQLYGKYDQLVSHLDENSSQSDIWFFIVLFQSIAVVGYCAFRRFKGKQKNHML
ncbi:hypothetical protein P9112_012720 [Eukaryota sp. TZLM1-RC]